MISFVSKFLLLLLLATTIFVKSTGESMAQTDVQWWQKEWKVTDFSKTSIDFKDIMSGGPPKDGIPSIDKPLFHALAKATKLGPQEPVIGLSINGDARAYPLRILMWHEIVNDTVGGVPVSVTYCPLCNTSIVFERTIDGKIHDFGTTGKLRFSDLVMYDRQTESWWQQFSGEAIVGKMLGRQLAIVPSRLESFENFKKRFPGGKVLRGDPSARRDYGRNPYANYDSAATPFLYKGDMPEGINPMARVVVVKSEGKKYAVALELLRKQGSLKIADVELSWQAGQNSALDNSRIKKGRDVGNVVAQKQVNGRLQDVAYEVTFAFAFHAFAPDRPIKITN
jgi:Protein of unknown function (DUF3179)